MPPNTDALSRHSSDYEPDSTNRLTHCRVEGCDRTDHRAHGLCNKHYRRWLRSTRPEVLVKERASNRATVRRKRGFAYDLGRCEECGGVFGVFTDGTFYRSHLNADGSKCRGWDLPVSVIVAAAS